MARSWTYEYSGLRVASDFELPEWAGFEATEPGAQQVNIVSNDSRSCATEAATGSCAVDALSFDVPDVGTYRVCGGNTIHVQPAPGAGMREVRLFLLGRAWGALLYQRGLLPLHAGVVRVGAGAVAFCGPSGSGKSTMVAWLAGRGYTTLSDDLCRCELEEAGPARVWPSALRLKLWRDALGELGLRTDGLERDHFRAEKFHLPARDELTRDAVPLHAIYLLEWGDPAIVRLSGSEGLLALVSAATYHAYLLEQTGKLAVQWQHSVELLRRVTLWELRRPKSWRTLNATMALLLAHWQDIGLLSEASSTS